MAIKRPVFKPYNQQQTLALPPTLEELIPQAHPVRVVNEVINRLNFEPLLEAYNIRGSSSYRPQMLLKVVVYGYVTNIYSSRKLAAACKESAYLMWLSSMSYPDHNTINRFRGVRLKSALRSVFEDVVKLLAEEGLLSIDEVNTEWHNIVLWEGLDELASKYLKKGSLVYIEGKLKTRKYEDKAGEHRYVSEIYGETLLMLDKPEKTNESL